MKQPVRLVDADPINNLSAIFGYHVEDVINQPCFRAVLANRQAKSSVHVHRYRFNLGTSFWSQLFEKKTDRCPAAAFHSTRRASASNTTLA